MSFMERAQKIGRAWCDKSKATIREIANHLDISKSSVQRHIKSKNERIKSVGHDFFETEAGQQFVTRLFYLVIFIFGLKSGVGSEMISLFFSTLMLSAYVAHSESYLRTTLNKMRANISTYDDDIMETVLESCENKSLHLGGDETFFGKQLFLTLMDLPSGFLLNESISNNRKFSTWLEATKAKLSRLKNIKSFIMDGGTAIKKLSDTLEVSRIVDLYHVLQDATRAFGAQFSAKNRNLDKQIKTIKSSDDLSDEEKSRAEKTLNEKRDTLNKSEGLYKSSLFSLSTQCHPFKEVCQALGSDELEQMMLADVKRMRNVMASCNLSDKRHLLDRCERRVKPLSSLNDHWHAWVKAAVQIKTSDPQEQAWATECLLPLCYWQWQLKKSKRNKKQRDYYKHQVDQANKQFASFPLTAQYLTKDWEDWGIAMSFKYQRTTSAVEGRNARLSYHYFSSKGIRENHVKSLTAIHNFWIKRTDGTTACERLCGFKPPDMFEWLLQRMGSVAMPGKKSTQAIQCAVA